MQESSNGFHYRVKVNSLHISWKIKIQLSVHNAFYKDNTQKDLHHKMCKHIQKQTIHCIMDTLILRKNKMDMCIPIEI